MGQWVSKSQRCRQMPWHLLSSCRTENEVGFSQLLNLAWLLLPVGKKALILSRMPLSLGDICILREATLLISPAEAMVVFRGALTMLWALQGGQGVLVTLPAARSAGIHCCSRAKHTILGAGTMAHSSPSPHECPNL